MSLSSEHFGWPSFYEDPEQYWEDRERRHREALADLAAHGQRRREASTQKAVQALLDDLTRRGLLREDRLSYTRICWLEHETGVFTGSWAEYYALLREAA